MGESTFCLHVDIFFGSCSSKQGLEAGKAGCLGGENNESLLPFPAMVGRSRSCKECSIIKGTVPQKEPFPPNYYLGERVRPKS